MALHKPSKHYHPNHNELQVLVEEFRSRIKESEFAVPPRTDTAFLLKILRTKKYSVDRALFSINGYYANIERNQDIIKGARPSDFQDTMRNGPVVLLKNRQKGRRVGIVSSKWRPKEIPLHHIQMSAVFLLENIILELETQDNGCVIVFDLKDLCFEHLWHLNPRQLKLIMYAQESLPLKISEVHILHPPPLFWTLYKFCSRFLKEKMRKRIHLHSDVESLHGFLDLSVCPESIGGELTEKEAMDIEFVEEIIRKDVCYEDMWNRDRVAEAS